MPYQTEEKLKAYLDTNQLHREQMCLALLASDQRFSEVRPRHPRGGPDGSRDIEALFRGDELAFGAVGFVNQANDSSSQKRVVKAKFEFDLKKAVGAAPRPLGAFIFFTNVCLTIGEKERLIQKAKTAGVPTCEVFDRERLRVELDSTAGLSIRFQFLGVALSEAEQASFFSRWGDEIQAVVSRGFDRVESALNRVLFLQEAGDSLAYLSVTLQLDKKYSADEIGHFRCFCSVMLKELSQGLISIVFGSSDRAGRIRIDLSGEPRVGPPGIRFGMSGGQWEQHLPSAESSDSREVGASDRYVCVGTSSSIGRDEVEFLTITYNKDSLFRVAPEPGLKAFNGAMFIFFLNRALSQKVKSVHVHANSYKLVEITELQVDDSPFDCSVPVEFDSGELADNWVRIRPAERSSAFHFRFDELTPTRLFAPEQVRSHLKSQ